MFQLRLQRLDHGSGIVAVDETMIERGRQVHHTTNRDLSVEHHHPLCGLVDADNGDLR